MARASIAYGSIPRLYVSLATMCKQSSLWLLPASLAVSRRWAKHLKWPVSVVGKPLAGCHVSTMSISPSGNGAPRWCVRVVATGSVDDVSGRWLHNVGWAPGWCQWEVPGLAMCHREALFSTLVKVDSSYNVGSKPVCKSRRSSH